MRTDNTKLSTRVNDCITQNEGAQRDLAQANKEISELLAKIKEKEQTTQKHKEKLAEQGSKIKSQNIEIGALQKSMTTVQAELQQSTENLKSIKAFGLALQEDNTDEA